MSAQVGERVGAVLSASNDEINFLGYGVRLEDELPTGASGMGELLVQMGRNNPTILLDSGKRVYGCECWWAGEAEIQAMLAKYPKVVEVDIDDARKDVE